jgi:hypothetical protein
MHKKQVIKKRTLIKDKQTLIMLETLAQMALLIITLITKEEIGHYLNKLISLFLRVLN